MDVQLRRAVETGSSGGTMGSGIVNAPPTRSTPAAPTPLLSVIRRFPATRPCSAGRYPAARLRANHPCNATLFDTSPQPWDLDDQQTGPVADVVMTEGAGGRYSYLVPERLADQVLPGRRVRAPLGRGNRAVIGWCVGVETKTVGRPLKELQAVVDAQTLLSAELLETTQWMGRVLSLPLGSGD